MNLPVVGERRTVMVVEDLQRTQIVMYAGASGDYNAIHTDEVFAREVAGQPAVMAHGMLTMGMAARAVTECFPGTAVRRYRARFTAPVWPADTLTATITVREVEVDAGSAAGHLARLDLVVRNQDQAEVLTGELTVAASAIA